MAHLCRIFSEVSFFAKKLSCAATIRNQVRSVEARHISGRVNLTAIHSVRAYSAATEQSGPLPVVAVVTASSNSGSQTVRELLGRYEGKVKVRAGLRSREKWFPLLEEFGDNPNLEAVVGITADSEGEVAPVFEGADYAVIVTPHDLARGFADDAELTANMIRAAVRAGVKHIVYVGSWTVHCPEASPEIASRFVPSEELLKTLGDAGQVGWTSLRSGFFFGNFVNILGPGLKIGDVKFPNCEFAACDPGDMGRVAAALVTGGELEKHHEMCYDISGPEIMTIEQVTSKIATAIGKDDVKFEHLRPEEATFLPPFLRTLFVYMYSKGRDAVPFSDATKRLCGEHTSLDVWLENNKSKFIA